MKPSVVLIRTPAVLPKTSITAQQGVPSLALAYLGAALKQALHSVIYIDALGENLGKFSDFGVDGLLAAGLNIPEILLRIPPNSKYIGVSCQFSNDWIIAKKLLFEIHAQHPQAQILVGGEHVTADFETILLKCPFVSACILGEGEETFIEAIDAFENQRELKSVDGLGILIDNKPHKTKPRKRIRALDEIPWPDWDGLPIQKYLNAGLGMAAQGIRTMPVLASRGCPYRCTFCSAPQMWDAKWYGRNIQDVLNEIRSYQEKYRIDHIEFYDMSPSIYKKWLEEFVERMQEVKISWNFPSGMRSENLSHELILKMKKAGCYKLTFAIETSAPKLIKRIKKKVNPDRALGLIRYSASVGLITKVNFIWGIEGQTKFDVLYDYYYICKLAFAGLHDASCFAFVPYPGSEDFANLKAKGQIPEGDDYEKFLAFNVYNNPFKMKSWSVHIKHWHMTFWTLGGMALFYSLQFLLRPQRIFLLIRRLWIKKPETMLELAFFGIYLNFIQGRKRKNLVRFEKLDTGALS